jgi:V/A-type H+-transporting ATPase subunit A
LATGGMELGKIIRVTGPVVIADGMEGSGMYEMVRVGEEGLIGEIIGLQGSKSVIQVYEETTGLRPGEKVEGTGVLLSVELGPGLVGSIYDGIQRPLEVIKEISGDFIRRGVSASALPRDKRWDFRPTVKRGQQVEEGSVIGTVKETEMIEHRIMIPPGLSGSVLDIHEGKFTVEETVCLLRTSSGKVELKLMQTWPVRKPRPYRQKLDPSELLLTGPEHRRHLLPGGQGRNGRHPRGLRDGEDRLPPPGGQVGGRQDVVYVGCGERGNEMCDVLVHFPELKDPQDREALMERTVLIANTSNMPVAAREASVYTGITLGEYFRDMGYDVALMADSTSRWAEAMREISGGWRRCRGGGLPRLPGLQAGRVLREGGEGQDAGEGGEVGP